MLPFIAEFGRRNEKVQKPRNSPDAEKGRGRKGGDACKMSTYVLIKQLPIITSLVFQDVI